MLGGRSKLSLCSLVCWPVVAMQPACSYSRKVRHLCHCLSSPALLPLHLCPPYHLLIFLSCTLLEIKCLPIEQALLIKTNSTQSFPRMNLFLCLVYISPCVCPLIIVSSIWPIGRNPHPNDLACPFLHQHRCQISLSLFTLANILLFLRCIWVSCTSRF